MDYSIAVSYTHLDVYKRQPTVSATPSLSFYGLQKRLCVFFSGVVPSMGRPTYGSLVLLVRPIFNSATQRLTVVIR